MKKILKIIALILGIPITCVLLLALVCYLAIFHNFWPPDCKIIPIMQARRVCEFTRIEKVKVGTPTTANFWVSVPFTTAGDDKVFLVIEGEEPIEMKKVSDLSYATSKPVMVGTTINYSYQRNDGNSLSDKKNITIKSLNKKIYDPVSAWSDQPTAVKLPERKIVVMTDTWTFNYNMNLFEDTRRNLDSSFARVKALGAQEVGVFSFASAYGEKSNFKLQEDLLSFKRLRDNSITEGDMKNLAAAARKYGLEVVIHYNSGADFSKYINIYDFSEEKRGRGGDAAAQKAADDLGFDEPKTRQWIDMWFNTLSSILVTWAQRAERTGIYGIDITPQYRVPTFSPEDEYANQKYIEMIANMRKVYKGKIFGSTLHIGGIKAETYPSYLDYVDGLYIYSHITLQVGENATVAEMQQARKIELDEIETRFKDYPHETFYILHIASYDGTTSGKPWVEFNDFAEVLARGYKADWQEQADSYEGMLAALNNRQFFKAIGTSSYWYDDVMDPDYTDHLTSMHPSIRNKPAEAVWKKWVLSTD